MPAIITHHLFGEDASALLPDGVLVGQEDLLAFLLGNQGPDPLWARVTTTPGTARTCHQLATRMHAGHVGAALLALRRSVASLPEDDMGVGRAFTLGMAAHYLLDSTAHPLIYALQEELVAADPELADARGEVHALIESDIDSWALWQKRRQTVLEMPCAAALSRTDRIDRVAGALVSQVAWEVFGLEVGAAEYGRAVRDYQRLYRAIDPPAARTLGALSCTELLARPYSRLRAQAHRVVRDDECPSANLEHHLWRNPATGEASRASLPDLYHDALAAWPAFSRRLVEGDRPRLEAMIGDVNYDGRPGSA